MASPEMQHRVSQLRHDVDDVFELLDAADKKLDATRETVSKIALTQRRHGNRLEEIQTALDLSVGRLDRLEEGQHRLEDGQRGLEEGQRGLAESQRELAESQREQGTKLDAILTALRGERP